MTWNLSFYRGTEWPDETGIGANGGSVDTGTALVGVIHEIFDPAVSSYEGGTDHVIYRKMFMVNDDGDLMQDASVFLHNAKYPGMLSIAVEKVAADTGVGPANVPDGYVVGDFVEADGQANALAKVVGGVDLASGEDIGVWIRLDVPAGLQEADSNVPINLVAIGNR